MKSKVNLVNNSNVWDAKRRYKINTCVHYNGADYQNATGINTEPGTDSNWIHISKDNLQSVTDGESNNITSNPIKVNDLYLYDAINDVYVKICSDNGEGFNFFDENGHLQANINAGSYITKATDYTYQLDMTASGGNRRAIFPGGFDFYVNGCGSVDNYANDTLAAAGGISIGQFYHTSGVVKIRLT